MPVPVRGEHDRYGGLNPSLIRRKRIPHRNRAVVRCVAPV